MRLTISRENRDLSAFAVWLVVFGAAILIAPQAIRLSDWPSVKGPSPSPHEPQKSPPPPAVEKPGEVPRYPDGANFILIPIKDGMMRVTVKINGVVFNEALIDTGAFALTIAAKTDAPRLGIKPSSLNYDLRMSTANGVVRGASYTFRTIQIGDRLTVRDCPGVIDEGAVDSVLLGRSFLERLGGLEVHHDYAILRF